MDSRVREDLARSDVDAEMTVLTPEDITGQNLDGSDEVENLRNSLREAVHDDNVRPKMQCLMMDSSFSMVTVQGEDSGIAWETTPSRCTTPWASEAGSLSVDLGSQAAARPATPHGSHPAGKIIFVMDEELITRRKKTKERGNGQKSRREVLVESSENVSGRPELVEVSQPNVKTEGEDDQEEPTDQLFGLVSEGSEILNIIVPSELELTVDEEESKEMVDNLSYLEESPLPKASENTQDNEFLISVGAPVADHVRPSPPRAMDPPGAPVARPPGRRPPGNVDYFEAFALVDAQAPGSPAVIVGGQVEAELEAERKDAENPPQFLASTITGVDNDKSDAVSLEELTSELLDEVFYGGTDNYPMKSLETEVVADGAPTRLPSKPSGSNLFGSQEDVLTPIFLPDGPPKIIDPILLEEPKAMAFLYTDLYEEAIGSRKKEEDTESMTSEKSFHSRHSDREARGYLEKYVLIDETPVVEAEPSCKEKRPEEGPRVLTQDVYDLGNFQSKGEQSAMPQSEEELTDFLRSSDNSSPCDIDPFPRSVEEEDTKPTTKKTKAKPEKSVSIVVAKVPETPVDPLSLSSFDFPSEELDWLTTDDHPTVLDDDRHVRTDRGQAPEINTPVAPPRRKAASSPKMCLDLTPLTPVALEEEEAGGKEQREEEKETASPAETADEGDGDGDQTTEASTEAAPPEKPESPETDSREDTNVISASVAKPAVEEDPKTEEQGNETELKQTDPEEKDVKSLESDNPEKQGDASSSAEPAKNKGQCIIL
ncbi:cardiomyopathy-associated protein 5 [Mugil cephalus]|uniref:cardiomyopathy-associated protein 5 n=1 Tax=Mugil cephalus TaxID=48193 RepID=UPI001FB725D1|nr:cardiomyopathy-associated protein 5 [Mugil cephalus]